ncbi:hypothetical protein FJZ31_05145 [Candidatus Poribacteria bacterium]|nr:hypothetical protein [Candidatus Poribacteria bacterium]
MITWQMEPLLPTQAVAVDGFICGFNDVFGVATGFGLSDVFGKIPAPDRAGQAVLVRESDN